MYIVLVGVNVGLLFRMMNQTLLEWLVRVQSPASVGRDNPSLLIIELFCYECAGFTLVHAYRTGGRFPYLWAGVIIYGVLLEMVSYWFPDINTYWHAQSTVMLLGQRLPLFIICIYTLLLYTPCVVAAYSGVKTWAHPFIVGLTAVLFDYPLDVLSAKHLWWTWHDSDPNLLDRSYWVPWANFYFLVAGFAGFSAVFLGSHRVLAGKYRAYQYSGFVCEITCVLMAALLGFPLGVLQFAAFFHPLHDTYHVHSEVCFLVLVAVYGLMVWVGGRNTSRNTGQKERFPYEILSVVTLMMSHLLCVVYLHRPENIRSTGVHQTIGPCDVTQDIRTPTGAVLQRKKYFCVEDYHQPFDFRCTNTTPSDGQEWYTICGTAHVNRAEYVVIVTTACGVAMVWCWLLLGSGGVKIDHENKRNKHIKQQ